MMALVLAFALLAQTEIGAPLETVKGTATHYCLPGQEGTTNCTIGYGPDDLVAAIDRKDTPWDKGDRLLVTSGNDSVVVTVVDTCACKGHRIIDLTSSAFRKLAPLGQGVVSVTVTDAAIELPATSTREERPTWLTHR